MAIFYGNFVAVGCRSLVVGFDGNKDQQKLDGGKM